MTRLIQSAHFSNSGRPAQPALAGNRFDGTDEDSRPLAGMLLAAVMAALLVAADQVIDNWADGHLLAAWVALWIVTFAALAVLATPLRRFSNAGAAWVRACAKASKERRLEEEMWKLARRDSRVMAEIRAALQRQTQD